MRGLARLLRITLLMTLVTAGLGVPARAISHDDCAGQCADDDCPAGHEGKCGGPTCDLCICGASVAPMAPTEPMTVSTVDALARRPEPSSPTVPRDPPARRVFHPPRFAS